MRCVIHHQGDDEVENQSLRTVGWMHRFHEPVLESQREFLKNMKRNDFGKKASLDESNVEHIKLYQQWNEYRHHEQLKELQEEEKGQGGN